MSAIAEGRAAYTLGSSSEANPYRKARHQFPIGFRDTSDNRLALPSFLSVHVLSPPAYVLLLHIQNPIGTLNP